MGSSSRYLLFRSAEDHREILEARHTARNFPQAHPATFHPTKAVANHRVVSIRLMSIRLPLFSKSQARQSRFQRPLGEKMWTIVTSKKRNQHATSSGVITTSAWTVLYELRKFVSYMMGTKPLRCSLHRYIESAVHGAVTHQPWATEVSSTQGLGLPTKPLFK